MFIFEVPSPWISFFFQKRGVIIKTIDLLLASLDICISVFSIQYFFLFEPTHLHACVQQSARQEAAVNTPYVVIPGAEVV